MTSRRPRTSNVDLLVVGGGVHGAAIARDAAARGLSVLLVEKNDFGWATSCRSSKLAHGGLRYLERLQVALVRESLRERDALLRAAPHLSWPLPFLIPLEGPVPRAAWKVRAGLFAYGLLAGTSKLSGHRVVEGRELRELAPALAASGVGRAALYHDAGMDDARIVVELVVDAALLGARCMNHARVLRLRRRQGRVIGALVERSDRTRLEVEATTTVLAAGPWTNSLAGRRGDGGRRLVVTKGVHLFFETALAPGAALLLSAPQDGRIFFVIPWKGGTLVGTTDTYHRGSADLVRPAAADERYLLRALRACLPAADVGAADVVAAQAGLRPLVAGGDSSGPAAVSRDWRLDDSVAGLLVVEGGKYTVFRALAERTVDRAVADVRATLAGRRPRPCATRRRPLPGAHPGFPAWSAREARRLARRGVGAAAARHLVGRYGRRATDVVAAAGGDRELLRPACDEHPDLLAEAVFAVTNELAATPADALLRRLGLGWSACGGLACRDAWAHALQRAGLGARAVREGLREHERQLHEHWRP